MVIRATAMERVCSARERRAFARRHAIEKMIRHSPSVTSEDAEPTREAGWTGWQRAVLTILQRDFEAILHDLSFEDVDWPAWHNYYLEGKSPRAAVNRALERDL